MSTTVQDPIFDRLCQTEGLLGVFSMTVDANVIQSYGDFIDENAEMYAPVIHSLLLDVKGILDTSPCSSRVGARQRETLNRVVLTYKSFTLSISRIVDTVYVVKITNTLQDQEDEEIDDAQHHHDHNDYQ